MRSTPTNHPWLSWIGKEGKSKGTPYVGTPIYTLESKINQLGKNKGDKSDYRTEISGLEF